MEDCSTIPVVKRSTSISNTFQPYLPPPILASTHPKCTSTGLKFALKHVKIESKKTSKSKSKKSKQDIMIVPPNTWSEDARKGFIVWGAAVGFGIRNAGGGVVFLVLKGDKIEGTKDTLEKAWRILKDKKKGVEGEKQAEPPLRRRSHTFPPNNSKSNTSMDVDMVIDEMANLTMEKPTQKPPRPSYSPTPVNIHGHNSDYFIRRRRRISGDWSPTPASTATTPATLHPQPLPAPTSASSNPNNNLSHDTPMIKKSYWGSQPNGLDWGTTLRAPTSSTSKIATWLDSIDAVYGSQELEPSKERSMENVPAIALVRRNTLTFDGEEDEEEEGTQKGEESMDEEQDSFGYNELPALGGDLPKLSQNNQNPNRLSRNISMGRRRSSMFKRESSFGASAMKGLTLSTFDTAYDEDDDTFLQPLGIMDEQMPEDEVEEKKRRKTMAKHRRVSMCANAMDMALPRRTSTMGGEEGFAGSAFSSIATGLGRMSSIGGGILKNRLSSMGGGFARLTSKFGMPVRIAKNDVEEDEEEDTVTIEENVNETLKAEESIARESSVHEALGKTLPLILSFLNEVELLTVSSLVNSSWCDESVNCQANLMLVSVGCEDQMQNGPKDTNDDNMIDSDSDLDSDSDDEKEVELGSVALSMKRPYKFLNECYPWAAFLSEGAFKRVYRVHNKKVGAMEALSVMDLDLIESTGNKQVVGAELAVSTLLSSLVRRNVCPNFIATRRVFTMDYEPPPSHWGDEHNKCPKGKTFNPRSRNSFPKKPPKGSAGRFQYIAMELCRHGDIEDYLKDQVGKCITSDEARIMLFQMAFSLHVAKEKFGLKHYDVKNLNFLLQDANPEEEEGGGHDHTHVMLRYAVGDDVFNLKMERERATIAKLADYGTADLRAGVEDLPISLAQFTTLENTPAEYLFVGEAARQGAGHDNFGLGLSMFHLFSGNAPYEEIMEDVKCGDGLKKSLEKVWEDEGDERFALIRSLINAEFYEEGDEKDFTLHDTLYRYLVLFGVPDRFGSGEAEKVFAAVEKGLKADKKQYEQDKQAFNLDVGNNYIVNAARERLEECGGAMDMLKALVEFDPEKRATSEAVLFSKMMEPLKEGGEERVDREGAFVREYLSFGRVGKL
ncbi:hypothetical protein TrLO_g14459 [Triparma laevis f. longispina]|nr:hypothetical protein TrLO_g14459 [Triparma laevis f. longispina]